MNVDKEYNDLTNPCENCPHYGDLICCHSCIHY